MAEKGLHVTNIRQVKSTEPDGNGGFHDVWKVHFTTPSGTATHVTVPDAEYTPKNVAAAIHQETAAVEGVHALEGQPLEPPAES